MFKGKYDICPNEFVEINLNDRTRQGSGKNILIPKVRKRKGEDNFFYRASYLLNIIVNKLSDSKEDITKKNIAKLYWKFFIAKYDQQNSCSWSVLCNCGNCNPINTL